MSGAIETASRSDITAPTAAEEPAEEVLELIEKGFLVHDAGKFSQSKPMQIANDFVRLAHNKVCRNSSRCLMNVTQLSDPATEINGHKPHI